MATGKKSGIGIGIVGFTFVVLGFIFLGGGKAAIGLPILGVGLIFIVVGVAATRKASPPTVNSETQPPAEEGGGTA